MESVLIFVCLHSHVDKIDWEVNGIKVWREKHVFAVCNMSPCLAGAL